MKGAEVGEGASGEGGHESQASGRCAQRGRISNARLVPCFPFLFSALITLKDIEEVVTEREAGWISEGVGRGTERQERVGMFPRQGDASRVWTGPGRGTTAAGTFKGDSVPTPSQARGFPRVLGIVCRYTQEQCARRSLWSLRSSRWPRLCVRVRTHVPEAVRRTLE